MIYISYDTQCILALLSSDFRHLIGWNIQEFIMIFMFFVYYIDIKGQKQRERLIEYFQHS